MHLRPRLRDIVVDAVTHECDMEIVGIDVQTERELLALRADVVIVSPPDARDLAVPARLLRALPRASVVFIAPGAESAAVYELRPRKTGLGEVSVAGLVAAIRTSAQDGATWTIAE